MQNDSSSAINQIREEIEAIKLRLTELEARLTEMEQSDNQELQEDMPENLEPIDLSSDLSPELIDLNDIEVLKRYVTEYGKIIPARVTGVTAMQQRQIKKGVRRARNMGLMA